MNDHILQLQSIACPVHVPEWVYQVSAVLYMLNDRTKYMVSP